MGGNVGELGGLGELRASDVAKREWRGRMIRAAFQICKQVFF